MGSNWCWTRAAWSPSRCFGGTIASAACEPPNASGSPWDCREHDATDGVIAEGGSGMPTGKSAPEVALLLQYLDEAYSRKAWHGPNLRGTLRGLDPAVAA